MVIQQIFDDFNLTGTELVVVGDGSVEIENAKAVGAIAVGVTSVENNRYQMNAGQTGQAATCRCRYPDSRFSGWRPVIDLSF